MLPVENILAIVLTNDTDCIKNKSVFSSIIIMIQIAYLYCSKQTNTQDYTLYCRQWAHFTMGPNEQNQHFAESRRKGLSKFG